MTNPAQPRTLSEAELIELQSRMEREKPDQWPIERLTRLSAHYLAALFPQHAEALLAGDHDKIAQGFAFEMLSENGFRSCTSLFTPEEKQRETYGGSEALMFSRLPEGIIEFYGKKLDPKTETFNPDPMTWDAKEFG